MFDHEIWSIGRMEVAKDDRFLVINYCWTRPNLILIPLRLWAHWWRRHATNMEGIAI